MSSADSPGRSTSPTEPLLIFDLDGTILSVNSFRVWVRYLLYGRFGGLSRAARLALSLRTLGVLAERKICRRDHYHAKRRLQRLWAQAADAQALAGLLAGLQRKVRPNMREALAHMPDAILATAAAGEYAQPFAMQLGFRHILATPLYAEPNPAENNRERKRDRALAYIAAQGWQNRKRIFFTDHAEDLPLIRECALTAWFGPDAEVAAIRLAAPDTEIIGCLNLNARQVRELAFPHPPFAGEGQGEGA